MIRRDPISRDWYFYPIWIFESFKIKLKLFFYILFNILLISKTLNPSSSQVNQSIEINDLKSANDSESVYQINMINKKIIRKIYLSLDMNSVLNTDVYDKVYLN